MITIRAIACLFFLDIIIFSSVLWIANEHGRVVNEPQIQQFADVSFTEVNRFTVLSLYISVGSGLLLILMATKSLISLVLFCGYYTGNCMKVIYGANILSGLGTMISLIIFASKYWPLNYCLIHHKVCLSLLNLVLGKTTTYSISLTILQSILWTVFSTGMYVIEIFHQKL